MTPQSEELRERIKKADTIAALDKLRMDVVKAKDREILVMWQEVRQLIAQHDTEKITRAVLDELDRLFPWDSRTGEGYYSVPGKWFDEHYRTLRQQVDQAQSRSETP